MKEGRNRTDGRKEQDRWKEGRKEDKNEGRKEGRTIGRGEDTKEGR